MTGPNLDGTSSFYNGLRKCSGFCGALSICAAMCTPDINSSGTFRNVPLLLSYVSVWIGLTVTLFLCLHQPPHSIANRSFYGIVGNRSHSKGNCRIYEHSLGGEQVPASAGNSGDNIQKQKIGIMPNICIVCDFPQCANKLMVKQLCYRPTAENDDERRVEPKRHQIVDTAGYPLPFVYHHA